MERTRGKNSSKGLPEAVMQDSEDASSNLRVAPFGASRAWRAFVLGLAIALVVLAVVLPRGLSPGIRMAHHDNGGPVMIGSTCTHYLGAQVSIAVPGPGTVVISATVGVGVNHTFGANDEARIAVAASTTECAITNYTAFVSVPASSSPGSSYYETVPLLRPFPVSSPGERTYYVNGVMAQGADTNDRFDSASLVAVFYPN
jgi:hypothetical protein